MRKTYFATFSLGRPESPAPELDEVLSEIQAWISSPRTGAEKKKLQSLDFSRSSTTRVGSESAVRVLRHATQTTEWAAVRFEHPDSQDPEAFWTVDSCLVADAGQLRFSMATSCGWRSPVFRPVKPPTSRPRLVRDLVRSFGAYEDRVIRELPWKISSEDVDELTAALLSATRRLPIVLVSCKSDRDVPLVDVKKVADRLIGLAHVCAFDSRWPSFRLSDRIGKELSCYEGAVRIYWPHFKRTSSPWEHKLWLPRDVSEQSQTREGFEDILLSTIARVATTRDPGPGLTFESILAISNRARMQELRAAGDESELLKLFDEENQRLEKEVESLQQTVDEAQQEAERWRARAESFEQAYLQLHKPEDKDEDLENVTTVPLSSVEDVVQYFEEKHADRVVFALNSKSSVRSNPYEDVDALRDALGFLAGTYFDAHTKVAKCADFDGHCREQSGFWYRSSQSDLTITKYAEYYHTRFDNRRLVLREHIGRGSGKDPRYTIRIAFAWDPDAERVVIGYIGQHQKTGAT